jgi:hypothetical protein
VKPGGNVAASTEKNPAPKKSHANRLTQRQAQSCLVTTRNNHPETAIVTPYPNRGRLRLAKAKQPSPYELGCLLIVVSVVD